MTNKSTTRNRVHIFILAVVLLLANQFLITTVNALYIYDKRYTTITVNSGVYTVSFNSPCSVTLGYISYANSNDLGKLATSIPSTFKVISKDSTYYSSYTTYSFSETSYFVLYNNGTTPCSVSTFSTSLEATAITSSTLKVRLPYGVKTTFYRYYSSYRNLIIKSDGSSTMSIALKIEYLSTAPSTTPTSVTSTYSISGYDSKSIDLSTTDYSSYYTAYIYLQCNNVAGCPVQLSLDYGSDSGSSTVIGAVVGPIVFVVIFVFIVIISVVSTIFARRRRMLLLAAATTAVATSSTTTHNYVPVPTPVSTTTTTTEKTTVYVPPPVTTTAQQPYIQPGVPQPYNPNYGNQAYYSQPPPTTTGQPYQPQPYTQPYAQPYTSQPYTPQPYQNQPPPPYYNPGVGVAQQEPMPAFNPNVDRV